MKLFSPILILIVLFSFKTKLNKTEKMLVGVWQCTEVDFSDFVSKLSPEDKVMFDAMMPMMDEAFKTLKLTFKADGTYISYLNAMGEESENTGTWKLSEDAKSINTQLNETEEVLSVVSLTKSEMVLEFDSNGLKTKLKLVKQKPTKSKK
jgi:hypothetical protein